MRALAGLFQVARERWSQYPGFGCVAGFLPNDLLAETFPDCYETLFLPGEEFATCVVTELRRRDEGMALVGLVLKAAANGDDAHARALAQRIVDKMMSEVHRGPPYRKPVYYVAATQRGLSVAVVIDDRFWTAEW
jgi:hypothetical protein